MEDNPKPRPKVLIVDDEESVRMSSKYILIDTFDVSCVETTAKAYELLKKNHFDFIFLDMMIKNEDADSSINLLKFLTKEFPNIPVAIMSGTVSWMQRWDELKNLGARAYLGKPFEKEKIIGLIKEHT